MLKVKIYNKVGYNVHIRILVNKDKLQIAKVIYELKQLKLVLKEINLWAKS